MQIMPFADAKAYRFNPFDLTKVWLHGDNPLIEVGKLTLDRNVTDFHTEIEQAAFETNNLTELLQRPQGRPGAYRRSGPLVRRRRHGAQGVHPTRGGR